METTAALTNNHFKTSGVSTVKLTNLDQQIIYLQNDYEEMKKTREQAKQAMQAKFDEVYDKIKQTKEFIVIESNIINNSLLAFQRKFENEIIIALKNNKSNQHIQYAKKTDDIIFKLESNLKQLDDNIDEEKHDRISTEQKNLNEIHGQLSLLTKNFEWNRQTRIDNEKKFLEKIKNDGQASFDQIENLKKERINKVTLLETHVKHELQSQDKYVEGFKQRSIEEFNYQISHVQNEMDNRFDQQNKVVGDISGLVSTIQGTLKIMGKNI